VVDILDIKWESLIQQDGHKLLATQRGSALKRFSALSIFSQIGVSVAFAGEALVQKVKHVCQQQMNEEIASTEENESGTNVITNLVHKCSVAVYIIHSVLCVAESKYLSNNLSNLQVGVEI